MPSSLTFVDFPLGSSLKEATLNLPRQFWAAFAAVRQADIVHSGAAGWPVSPGLVVNPIAVLLRKPLVVVIESAFWRDHTRNRSLKRRVRHSFTEAFAKWSCAKAQLAIFTHEGYFRELLSAPKKKVLISPASWIDASTTLSIQEAFSSWDRKPPELTLLVAARFVEEKGIRIVAQMLEYADAERLTLRVDFIGDGYLAGELRDLAKRLNFVKVQILKPVPYGPQLFALIRYYHGVLVPTLSDEQPRIIFDSFSQAVPVIASNTDGNRELVITNETGILYDKLSSEALFDLVKTASFDLLQNMGINALGTCVTRTHEAMHHARARSLCEALEN